MNGVKRQIVKFFTEKRTSHPEIEKKGSLTSVMALEKNRANLFASTLEEKYVGLSTLVIPMVTATLYKALIQDYSIVMAFYDDGTILWLDDHSSNSDYEKFIQREALLKWIPIRLPELAALLATTKFSFLGTVRVVNNASDIKKVSDNTRKLMIELGSQDLITEGDQKLLAVSKSINPPSIDVTDSKITNLSFCIWIREFGRLINIHCHIAENGSFSYEGEQIATLIGDYFIPH